MSVRSSRVHFDPREYKRLVPCTVYAGSKSSGLTESALCRLDLGFLIMLIG